MKFKPFGVAKDHPFRSLFDDMNLFFNDYPTSTLTSVSDFMPALDLKETSNSFTVTLELAGLDEKDIDLSLKDGVLTIKGERKFEDKKEDEHHVRIERSYGTFHRSVSIPSAVDEKSVVANFKNGLLTVTLPKKTQIESSHKIKIQS